MQVFSLVRAALASVLLLALPNIAMAGFNEGLAAYDRGDYATAYRELLLVATQADPKAQSSSLPCTTRAKAFCRTAAKP
jgi:hypothetical protein